MGASRYTAVMRLITIAMLFVAFGCSKSAEDSAAEPEGTTYGATLTNVETMTIAEVIAAADELEGERVIVEGLVIEVCATRGCWFQMADDGGKITFKVEDGVMVFPMSMKGKYAVAEGKVQTLHLDLKNTRSVMARRAEEQGKEFDPKSVTEPMTIVRLAGIGAVARDQK